MQKNREEYIDFLKGLSIIAVFLCHYVQVIGERWGILYHVFSLGQLAVPCFFFFTGYLSYEHINSEISYVDYLWKKVKKVIFPWWTMILLTLAITKICNHFWYGFPYQSNISITSIIVNMFFLNGFVPNANNNVVFGGWFVGTLFIFWLILPLLKRLTNLFGNKFLVATSLMSIMLMLILGRIIGPQNIARNTFCYFSFFTFLPSLLIGMVQSRVNKTKNLPLLAIVCFVCILLSMMLFFANIPYTAIFQPSIMAIATWCTCSFVKDTSRIKMNKNISCCIFTFLMQYWGGVKYCGRNSLYIYLVHVIFVWHLQYIILKNKFPFREVVISLISLPLCFVFTLFLGNIIKKINLFYIQPILDNLVIKIA